MGTRVEISIQGRLEQRWSRWLDGATLTPGADGTTVLRGEVADQAALHALIHRIAGLGLQLVSVTQEPGD